MGTTTEQENPFYKLLKDESPLDQSPVFVVGFPRSGTTLLQSLVATQGYETFPETHYLSHIITKLQKKNNYILEDAEKICQIIEEKIPLGDKAKSFISHFKMGTISSKTLFEIIIMDNLLNQDITGDTLTKRWLEKTPYHVLHMKELLQWYPNAKFIFITRNPLKAFVSWRKVSQKWEMDRLPVEKYCELWLGCLRSAEHFFKDFPDLLLFTRLEDIVEDSAKEITTVMNFLGNEFKLENLNKRDAIFDKIVLPEETWKGNVNNTISKDISEQIGGETLTLFEQYRTYKKLKDSLKKYYPEITEIVPIENKNFSFEGSMLDLSFFEQKLHNQKLFNDDSKEQYVLKNEILMERNTILQVQEKVLNKLLVAIKKTSELNTLRHPLQKIKAYKQMMNYYHHIHRSGK